MGAKWVTVDFKESGEGQGGYAKESSDAFKKVQQDGRTAFVKQAWLGTAACTVRKPSRRSSPKLISPSALRPSRAGRVHELAVLEEHLSIGVAHCED